MGSPLSPIIANLYMEAFEKQTISTAPHPPTFWRRFVDDTFVIIQKIQEDSFFNHLNTMIGSSLQKKQAEVMVPCPSWMP